MIFTILSIGLNCQNARFNGKYDPLNMNSLTTKLYYLLLLTDPGTAQGATFDLNSGLPVGWTGDWIISTSSDHCFSDSCLKSSNYAHSSISYIETTQKVNRGSVTFYRYVNSELYNDVCQFFVDGHPPVLDVLGISGTGMSSPFMYKFDVYPGTHTFRWTYTKDNSLSVGSDSCWIDQVVFP